MRSLRGLLGLDSEGSSGSDGGSPRGQGDTETVRRIAGELDRLDPNIARFLARRVAGDLPERVRLHAVTVHENDRASVTYRPPRANAAGGTRP